MRQEETGGDERERGETRREGRDEKIVMGQDESKGGTINLCRRLILFSCRSAGNKNIYKYMLRDTI